MSQYRKLPVPITSHEFVSTIKLGRNDSEEVSVDGDTISFNRVEIVDDIILDSTTQHNIVLNGVIADNLTIADGCEIKSFEISNGRIKSISVTGGQIVYLAIHGAKIDKLSIEGGTINLLHIYQDSWNHKVTSPIPNGTIIKNINSSGGQLKRLSLEDAMLDSFFLDGGQIDLCELARAKIGELHVYNKGFDKLHLLDCQINELVAIVAIVSESMVFRGGSIQYLYLTSEFNGEILISDVSVCDLNLDYLLNKGIIKLVKVDWPNPINPMLITINSSSLGDFEVIGCDWSNAIFTIDKSKLIDMFYTDTIFSDKIVSAEAQKHRIYQQIGNTCGQLMAVADRINDRSASLKFRAKSKEQLYEMKKLSMWLWSNTERRYDPRISRRVIVYVPSFIRFGWYALWRKEWWEWFQLWMSKISNEFGTNYVRALVVLVTIGAVLFGLYLPFTVASKSLVPTWEFWEWPSGIFYGLTHHFGDYLGFLNPTRSLGYLCAKNAERVSDCDSQWALVIDWTSRIIIGYLIYQFIQAFRKYGKG